MNEAVQNFFEGFTLSFMATCAGFLVYELGLLAWTQLRKVLRK